MSLTARYQHELQHGGATADPAQQVVVEELERLLGELPPDQPKSLLGRLFRRRPQHIPKGVYLWGGVGRGKTWLMDMFFDAIPGTAKERLHFHRFMRTVHNELKRFEGQPNPLQLVVRDLARRIRILCLDEFDVVDIGDAMILAGLLRALFDEGIVLVTTSNQPPDNLYPNGIQRASFIPAIALLNRYTEVIHLGGDTDFRRRALETSLLYQTPADTAARQRFEHEFTRLAGAASDHNGTLEVMGRRLPYQQRIEGMVWFDFDALCGPPRSQHDYIEVARGHHTVFISDIPQLDDEQVDRTRRFIFLVDEFYDRRVKVVLSAATPMEDLYHGTRLRFEFERTASRLQEMQTSVYLGRSHKG